MSINKTTTDLSTLKINYLTQEMYENALENDEINENELYVTPGGEGGGGTSNTLLYGVCDTAADTVAKTATIDNSFELVEGATIAIKFTNANTATNPTLNINNTGAKAIKRYGNTNAGIFVYTSWSKGEVVPLLYDGTYWQIMYNMAQDHYVTQTYSTNNNNYNLALSSYTNTTIGVSDLNHSTKIKGNPSTGRITTEDMTSQEVDDFVDGLNVSGGGNQVQTRKLLYTNTTAPFSAQTVSLDLSDYDYIEVWFMQGGTSDAILPNPQQIPIGEFRNVVVVHAINTSGTNENTGARLVTVTTTGVSFGDYSYKNRRSEGTQTVANQFAIPQYIYGIKYL